MDIPEPGRQAAHVLLDAVSVFREDDSDSRVLQLAVDRLDELDVIEVVAGDDGVVTLRVGDLVGGTLVLVQHLVTALAVQRGTSREVVIADARGVLDG